MPNNHDRLGAVLANRLAAREDSLRAALKEARAQFENSTDKATVTEHAFRKFLGEHLPRKYGIGFGEAWDEKGTISPQLDVVIAGPEHPFTYSDASAGLFFVEGVVAAAEVKAVLTSDGLADCIRKGIDFKALTANFPIGSTVLATESDLFRFGLHPPYWCFAYESQLTLDAIHSRLEAAGRYSRGRTSNTLDAVFVLDRGAVIDFGDGDGTFGFRRTDGSAATGWLQLGDSRVLHTMLAWLYAVSQPVAASRSTLLKYLVPDQ